MIDLYSHTKGVTTLEQVGDVIRDKIQAQAKKALCDLVGIAFVVSKENIGATHNAPIGERPRFHNCNLYKGYRGRMWLRFSREPKGSNFSPLNCLERTLTYLGTGGGGNYESPWTDVYEVWNARFRTTRPYDYQHNLSICKKSFMARPNLWGWTWHLYLQDWPELMKAVEKRELVTILRGERISGQIQYIWEDTDQVLRDAAFMLEPESKQAYAQLEFQGYTRKPKWDKHSNPYSYVA